MDHEQGRRSKEQRVPGVSRRQWLRSTAAGLGLLVLPALPGRFPVRRRRRSGPPPTGWFGHC